MSDPWTTPYPDLRQRLDDLFEELIYRRWSLPGPLGWRPPVDLHETPDAYLVVIDVPDIPPDQVEIRVTEFEVMISGDRPDSAPGGTLMSHRERRAGPFRRVLNLVRAIDPERARAECRNGTCRVTLPKRQPEERLRFGTTQDEPMVGRAVRLTIR